MVLIFMSVGVSLDDVCASDLNQSMDGIQSELNIKDKLGNSQEDIVNMNLEEGDQLSVSQDGDVLGSTIEVSGGSFTKVRNAINNANPGDTIKLKGNYYAEKEFDQIRINKQITLTADSRATFDAKGLTHVFVIQENAKKSTFNNLKIVNGYRNGNGAGMYINASGITIKNCIFQNNNALAGAAICTAYNNYSAKNLIIEDCKFVKNHAQKTSGAVAAFGDNTKLTNCIFDSNGASNDIASMAPYGGAIQIGLDDYRARGYITGCKFINNYVDPVNKYAHGGAGCVRDGIEYKNCIFINNSAAQGGALTYHASGLIYNCTFINNSATKYGGALSTGYNENGYDLNVKDCSFEGNIAPNGGAVQLNGIKINIEDCKFDNNNASKIGGAINIDAETVKIIDSDFNNNNANVDGGAVFIKGKNTQIKDSSFIHNNAIPDASKLNDGLGGAIYINSSEASVDNNEFYYNTARNGSAIYYDNFGKKLKLSNNTFYQNQAWVYLLPISAKDIYYGESEKLVSIIHGGNNIGKYGDLASSNAIYNAADNDCIEINGEIPRFGAIANGQLYQDEREYEMDILLTVTHEDGSVVYNKTLKSNVFGEVSATLNNLKVGKYFVTAKHYEDNYYKAITNATSFKVTAQIDNKVKKSIASDKIDYNDIVVWTLNITNNGPSNATNVVVRDILPNGLSYISDNTNGAYNPKDGTLTIPSLKVGEVYIVEIKTQVKKTGEITNKVNVTAKEYDYNLTNNHDQSKINVNKACDLAVKKSVNVSLVNLGDTVKWTITVSNNGPDGATGVVVSDVLPKSLIWVSDDGSGKYNHNTGVWNVGSLNKGSVATLNINCKVNATGNIKNQVSVTGNEHDYNPSNNHDDEVIRVNPACDLGIVKVVSSSVVNYLDVVKWTLTVSNYGPDAASGVRIYDRLPDGFVYLNSTKPYAGGVIEVGNLAVGGKVVVDIYSRASSTGNFVNTAKVNGSQYDYNPSNNQDNVSILVKPATDLVITKDVNNSSPNFGDEVKWTLTAYNNGPDRATGVVVSDVLPKSLIWVSDDGSGKYNHNTGVWNVGSLNKGSVATLNINCKVNATGNIKNQVSVTGNEHDYNPSNNHDDEVIRVNPACDLGIVKVVSSSVVNYLDVVKWTLTVSNYGPDAASGVRIYDRLPDGFVYLNSTKPYVDGVIEVGNLAVGGKVVVDIYSRASSTGNFINIANVKGNEHDYNPSNNQDNASILVKPATDLAVIKEVNDSTPNYQDNVKWTIRVSNNGPDRATGVVVSDVLPKSLIWVSDDGLGKYNHVSGKWNVGILNKGQTIALNIITKVNATGLIENMVYVSGNEFDYNKSNNKDSKIITVANASDLSVIKLTNQSVVNYLQLVKWTIIASNNGPNKATGVTVDELLPAGLKVINYTATKGFYDNNIWAVCCLESGETQTLDLICKVEKTGDLTNIVKINGSEYDPDLSNNDANESISVPKASDLSVVKTVDNSNPNYGDIIEWRITVTNNGPDDAEDTLVLDILPQGLQLLSYRSTVGSYVEDLWDIGYLKNGASESLVLRCIVKTLGDVENIVTVMPSQYDWNDSNNKDSENITVSPVADVAIIKLINVSEANYLDLVEWILIVTNYGPNDATNVFVSDIIPDGLTVVDVIGDGLYEESIWDIGDLANGESKQLSIVCKVQATGGFTNAASVWAEELDPDLTNNEDQNHLFVYPASDLSITKTVSKYKYSVGDLVTYSIKLTNNGPNRAENIKVSEIMDKSLDLKSFRASAGDFDKLNDVWSLDFLDEGRSALLKINALATKAGTAKNKVVVKSDTYDPDLSNNNDTVSIDVVEKQNSIKIPKNNNDDYHKSELKDSYHSVLQKNKSGNPIMVIVLLFVFTMGAIYGNNILKKR